MCKNDSDQDKISLNPLGLEEALKGAMETQLEENEEDQEESEEDNS